MSSQPRSSASSEARQLADGFAAHIRRWVLARGATEEAAALTARAARAASAATAGGHVCVMLDELEPVATDTGAHAGAPADALRQTLLGSGVVGTPEAPGTMPLILDTDGRLYLHRYFDYEQRLARRLAQAGATEPDAVDDDTAGRLNSLFSANVDQVGAAADWQKLAAGLALRRRLVVISGGPGTGKTTTVVNLLACLLARAPDSRIALAAPTGKAAARMTEAIRSRAEHLPPALRDRMPHEPFTVHRLLGVRPGSDEFVHHAGNPLAIDALVVDEASMLDLSLATRLLEAVPPGARIVLLGDKDQLAAVEAGAVFAELSTDPTLSANERDALARLCATDGALISPSAPARPGPLPDTTVWFTRNFRFAADSGIGRFAADIRSGDADGACRWLREGADASVRWIEDPAPTPAHASWTALAAGFDHYLATLLREPLNPAEVLDAFGRFRALCATREGPRGVVAVNERMTHRARAELEPLLTRLGTDARSPWFAGRPVMVLANDHLLKLFNGDIGIALPHANGQLAVFFPDATAGLRAVPPVRMPAHETAFATTVHKSQGSEFDEVMVMLPERHSPVVSRELLYTAVTRAASRVTLCAGEAVIAAAIRAPTQRQGGLLTRLAGAMGELTDKRQGRREPAGSGG